MYQVMLRLLDICMLRAGPQDLPASRPLMNLLFATYIVVGVLAGRLLGPIEIALLESVFDAAVVGLVLYGALNWRGLAMRFVQTYSAVLGCGVVINVLALPVIYSIASAQASGASSPTLALTWLAMLGWDLAVFAHILRHAFNIGFGRGLLFSVVYFLLYYQLASRLFVEAA